jgi:type IV pilus assembly protein PilN
MIRINLLAAERESKKKKATFQSGQKVTFACSLVLVLAAVLIGWRYTAIARESKKLDDDIVKAQNEATRLHAVIQQVQQFEAQKAQLQQRVVLIEQLRRSQTGPVHMLDQVSRSMPPMLWLTGLKQDDSGVTIDGRSTTQTGVSDFVGNLEGSGYFRKSVDIVVSQTESITVPPGQLVKFSLKGVFQTPADAAAAAAAPATVAKNGAKPK